VCEIADPLVRDVDLFAITAGITLEVLFPELPQLGGIVLGAGIGGLQYDGMAAFNAVVYKQKNLSDVWWGGSMLGGAVFGFVGATGAPAMILEYMESISARTGVSAVGSTLKWFGSKIASKAGFGALTGKITITEVEDESVASVIARAAKTASKPVVNVAKDVTTESAIPTLTSEFTTVGGQMIRNVKNHRDIWEGVGEAAVDGLVKGVLSGGMSSKSFLNIRCQSLFCRCSNDSHRNRAERTTGVTITSCPGGHQFRPGAALSRKKRILHVKEK
jgi:hypothetical protein